MCLSCGCNMVDRAHDDRSITLTVLAAAAEAAGISVREAAANIRDSLPIPGPLPALFFDVDGTLAFQPEASMVAVNARFGASYLTVEGDTYPFVASLPEEQAAWLTGRLDSGIIHANLAPDTKAIGVLHRAQKHGYNIAICTERPPAQQELTAAWLKAWRVPCDRLYVVGRGGKQDLLAQYGPDDPVILVDDSPFNAQLVPRDGVQVWQPARPYNSGPPDGVWRFDHWHDVAARLGLA
ncbi:MAG: hypothetical protein JWP34_5105 [Massilia sp.]|nr:hypothetical protein [Massilia sp.]